MHVERRGTGIALGRRHTDCHNGFFGGGVGADCMDRRNHPVRKGLLLVGVPPGNAAGLLCTYQPAYAPAACPQALPLRQCRQPFPLHMAHTYCRMLHSRSARNYHLDRPVHHLRQDGNPVAPPRGRMAVRHAGDRHLLARNRHRSCPSCHDGTYLGTPRTPDLQHGVPRGQFAEPAQLCPAFPFRHRHRPLHQLPGMRTRLQGAMHQPHRPRGGFVAVCGVLQLCGCMPRRRHPLHLAPQKAIHSAHAAGEASPHRHTLM